MSPILVMGDQYLGVENRITIEPDCVNEGMEIYRCTICREMAVYTTIEPIGHSYSDKEEVVLYPTVEQEGAYGKRCKRETQTGRFCEAYIVTKSIPKRTGNYSSIDSRFEVQRYSDNKEGYVLRDPDIVIVDERTWGAVPTVKYNDSENSVYVAFKDKNNQLVEVKEKINEEYVNKGYSTLHITILDSGKVDMAYAGLFG